MLHFVLAVTWYWRSPQPAVQEEITKARIIAIRKQTPPPAQTSAPLPSVTAAPKAHKTTNKIATPRVARSNQGNAGRSIAAVQPTPAPVMTASSPPRTGCPKPDASPGIAATPDAASLSASARSSRVSGTAAVDVALDAQGRVVDTKLARSSGNTGLDAGAIAMARSATYSPRYIACKAVAGAYMFTVKFVAW